MYFRGRHKRFSPIELLVLRVLKDKPLYGKEIINELEKEFKNTTFHAKSGTIYPILKNLKRKDLIEEEEGEQYKKKYSLTDKGRKKLDFIFDNDLIDGFMGFYHKFSDIFFTDFAGTTPSMKNIVLLEKEIRRLEKRKKFLERDLQRLNETIAKKKEKLKEFQKDVKIYDIPIE
ncbi:MAG: helix-turn-helix transcriptional regulator [Candidatus Helarchaeota archaeon]